MMPLTWPPDNTLATGLFESFPFLVQLGLRLLQSLSLTVSDLLGWGERKDGWH